MVAVCVGTGVGGQRPALPPPPGQQTRRAPRRGHERRVCLSAVLACFFLFFGLFLTRPFFGFFLTDSAAVAGYGARYLSLVTGCSIGMTMQFVTERILLASGDPVGPMVIQGVGR